MGQGLSHRSLRVAIEIGDFKDVESQISANPASVNLVSKTGKHPLARAVHYNRLKIFELLLRTQANVNYLDPSGETALYKAVQKCKIALVAMALDHKADPNVGEDTKSCHYGWYVFCDVRTNQPCSDERLRVLQLLLEHKLEVNKAFASDSATLLVRACSEDVEDERLVDLLIKYRAAVGAADRLQYTCLHHCARKGHINLIKKLVALGANVNATTSDGKTAKQLAEACVKLDCMRYLDAAMRAAPVAAPASSDEFPVTFSIDPFGSGPLPTAIGNTLPPVPAVVAPSSGLPNLADAAPSTPRGSRRTLGRTSSLSLAPPPGDHAAFASPVAMTPSPATAARSSATVPTFNTNFDDFNPRASVGVSASSPASTATRSPQPSASVPSTAPSFDDDFNPRASRTLSPQPSPSRPVSMQSASLVPFPTLTTLSVTASAPMPASPSYNPFQELESKPSPAPVVAPFSSSLLAPLPSAIPRVSVSVLAPLSPGSALCEMQQLCQRLLPNLHLRGDYFAQPPDARCFCASCFVRRADQPTVYSRGNPSEKYTLPVGWCGYRLVVHEDRMAEAAEWHLAYAGLHPGDAGVVLGAKAMPFPQDTAFGGLQYMQHAQAIAQSTAPFAATDANQIFMSPSIFYAGQEMFAQPFLYVESTNVSDKFSRFLCALLERSTQFQDEVTNSKWHCSFVSSRARIQAVHRR
eukprot:TRINITY_DN6718_c0_g2_i2.p1 TRINITY_DN6718_c0_g2~~TRINITY_DN6718_c0_g2_i2.p1  ORF type:complete len:695 (-),score=103.48 TRINITY_DN6718_c0_g2_i2:823-2907(-)